MQALATPTLPVLRQLAEPVDLEYDIFSALQVVKTSGGIPKVLVEEVDLEEDIFAALEAVSHRAALRGALSATVDLEEDIFSALDAASPRAALREALSASVDLEGDIFAALPAASSTDSLATLLRQNLAAEVDLEAGVMTALAPVASSSVQPAENVRPQAKIRSSAVERDIPRPNPAVPSRRMPWRAALVSLAAAAALAFFVVRAVAPSAQEDAFVLADRNVAEVEDLSASATASVQVMQFEENGPTFILVDEGTVSDKAVPL